MQATTLFALALLAPQVAAPRTDRPKAPYSLPPVSGTAREGESAIPPLIQVGAPAPQPTAVPVDDAVPFPVPEVWMPTPQGDVLVEPAKGDPFFLGFAAGDHHPGPSERVDARLYAAALADFGDGRPAPETYAFVMFAARMTPERLALLEAEGCRLLGLHPHYTQKVALPAAAVDRVAALPFVRWVGTAQPWQKVHPALSDELAAVPPNQPLEVWVSVFESDVGAASVQRTIARSSVADAAGNEMDGPGAVLERIWLTNGWMQAALEEAGLEVIDFSERIHAFRARMMPQGLDLVTALDFVQFVELDALAELDHGESMTMVNADAARFDFDGGVNSVAVAGMADSGMETLHQDVNPMVVGWDLTGAGGSPYDDACGHGTHVAGTLLGQGVVDPGLTGAAPGLGWGFTGLFLNLRVFQDCTPQPVDDAAVLGLLSSAYVGTFGTTPRPHVHNHSWGSGAGTAWTGTEAEPRLWDDNAYADAQLAVRSAGNGGPGYLTVGKQASAKNVLTVGSVYDWEVYGAGWPGQLADSSSRGPTADGRWKPNVVAPGNWITSADAFDPAGYVGKAGTSMAAPHVTGIAACLIDKEAASFAYLPERISAQLMATAHRKNGTILSTPLNTHLSEYGAGRVDATEALWSTVDSTWTSWAFGLPATWSHAGDFIVPAGATRLVVAMHYVEPAASAGASQALINDWDLWLDAPPIVSTTSNSGEYSAHQSPNDNTEIRVIPDPTPGYWRWKVHPDSTATSAYFGVTVYVQMGAAIPALTPSLWAVDPVALPGEQVQIDYLLQPTGIPLSSVFVQSSFDGAPSVHAAGARLLDGNWANLLGNAYIGSAMVLGNVNTSNAWRWARWNVSWPYSGSFDVDVTAHADNASNSGHTETVTVIVDGNPPGVVTGIHSTTHTVFGFSCDPLVAMTWDPAVDPLSGVAGYAYEWSEVPNGTLPSYVMTTGTSVTTTIPSSGGPAWYFRVQAIDNAGNVGQSASAGPYFIDPFPVSTYCLAKVNSQGCLPKIEGTGFPSFGSEFTVVATNVLNNKSGLLFWGSGIAGSPFQGGYKCVANPVKRTPVQSSMGSPPPDDCSGKYEFTFDASYMTSKGIAAGDTIYAQYWSRDPGASFTTGLTDAIQFTICP